MQQIAQPGMQAGMQTGMQMPQQQMTPQQQQQQQQMMMQQLMRGQAAGGQGQMNPMMMQQTWGMQQFAGMQPGGAAVDATAGDAKRQRLAGARSPARPPPALSRAATPDS